MKIDQFREQYPEYDGMSDFELGSALHKKHYPGVPYAEFARRFGAPVFDPVQYGTAEDDPGMLGAASDPNAREPEGRLTEGAKAARRSEAGVSFEGAREMNRKVRRLSELRREMARVAETRGMDWKVKMERIEALRQERNAIMESTVREMRRRQRQWEASQR